MKKLLLIIFCIPIFGFGQDDCGKKPKYKGNVFQKSNNNKEYKTFKKDLKLWEDCKKNKAENIEQDLITYFEKNKLEPIEGIWLITAENINFAKIAIKKNNDYFEDILLESYHWSLNSSDIGEIGGVYERMANKNMFFKKEFDKNGKVDFTCTCILESNQILKCQINNLEVSIIKQFPRNQSKSIKKNIQSEKWSGNGSGIIISKSGHIVTCNHVTNGAVEIEVEFILENEVKKFKAEVVQADKKNDLAILKIKDNNFNGIKEPPFKLNTVVGDVGTEVFAFGYPLALTVMGKEVKVTDGIISSKSGFEGDITTYQITAPIQGGNSGGPLFDNKGNLIGINSSGIRKDLVDNVAYSIKTNYVLNLIDMLSEPVDIPSKNSLVYLPLTEKIKQLSKYVVLVKVK